MNPPSFNSLPARLAPFSIINQPQTKPVRCMVAIRDSIEIKGMTKSMARKVVAALALAENHSQEYEEILREIVRRGM